MTTKGSRMQTYYCSVILAVEKQNYSDKEGWKEIHRHVTGGCLWLVGVQVDGLLANLQ